MTSNLGNDVAACAHLRVSWRTCTVAGLTRGWWECDYDCGAKFELTATPAPATSEGREEFEKWLEDVVYEDNNALWFRANDGGGDFYRVMNFANLVNVPRIREVLGKAILASRSSDRERVEELPCGHPASLLIKSVESDYQFCELCEAKSERADAAQMEAHYKTQLAAAESRVSELQREIERLKLELADEESADAQINEMMGKYEADLSFVMRELEPICGAGDPSPSLATLVDRAKWVMTEHVPTQRQTIESQASKLSELTGLLDSQDFSQADADNALEYVTENPKAAARDIAKMTAKLVRLRAHLESSK